jgi:hypothetical protein
MKLRTIAVGALLLLATACGPSAGGSMGGGSTGAGSADTATLSVAAKLAIVDGDESETAAFQDVVDCIMASGIKGAETEEKVGDTLYASWKASSQEETLLEWGQILCSG